MRSSTRNRFFVGLTLAVVIAALAETSGWCLPSAGSFKSPEQAASGDANAKSDAEKMKHTFTTGFTPLNELIVEHYINTMEWAFDMKLTAGERDAVLKKLIADWNAGDSNPLTSPVIKDDVDFSLISVYRSSAPADVQEQSRQTLLNGLLQAPDQPEPSQWALTVLKMYKTHHANSAGATSGAPASSSVVPAAAALGGGSAAVGGKLPEGMLNGVYASFHKRAYSLGFDPRFLVFFPNGTVIYLPQNGLAGFDVNAYVNDRRTDKALVGRYRDYGNYISVIWNDNPGHRDQLGHTESGGLGGYDSLSPAAAPNGLRFSGVYYWGQPNGIQFNADGTFFDQRAMDTLILPNAHFNNPRAMGGTYVIQDYTILLNYQDGSKMATSFVAPAHQRHGQSFDWIAMHGSILYGQGYQPQP